MLQDYALRSEPQRIDFREVRRGDLLLRCNPGTSRKRPCSVKPEYSKGLPITFLHGDSDVVYIAHRAVRYGHFEFGIRICRYFRVYDEHSSFELAHACLKPIQVPQNNSPLSSRAAEQSTSVMIILALQHSESSLVFRSSAPS
ncbi:hypothetical protein ABKN59_011299 [Abortiporus biennis]